MFGITAAMERRKTNMGPRPLWWSGSYQHFPKWHLDPWSFHRSKVSISLRAQSSVLCNSDG